MVSRCSLMFLRCVFVSCFQLVFSCFNVLEIGMACSRLFYVVCSAQSGECPTHYDITTLITLQSGFEWFELFGLSKLCDFDSDSSWLCQVVQVV